MATRPYTKVARAAGEERTRSSLLDSAERIFVSGRWDSSSLEAIASEAGVSKQTLLRHFGSKRGLFEAGYARAFEAVRAQRMVVGAGGAEAAIDNLLDHYYEQGAQSLAIAAMDGGDTVEDVIRRAKALHYEWVDRAFADTFSGLPAAEARRTRAALIAICDVNTWNLLANDLGLTRREVRATLLKMIKPLLGEKR